MAKNKQSKFKVSKSPLWSPMVYLRRQKYKRRIILMASVLLLASFSLLDRAGFLHYQNYQRKSSSDLKRYHQRLFRVVRVVDGDTIRIDAPDGRSATTSVRFWGVDTPETAKPRKGMAAEPFSNQATAFTALRCLNKQVKLILEPHRQRGKYHRLLAYVQLPNGQILNEQLIVAGLSPAERRFAHSQLKRYLLLEQQARHDKVGMWAVP